MAFRRRGLVRVFVVLVSLASLLDVLRVRSALTRAAASPPPPSPQRIYIAGMHWNSATVLAEHWSGALIRLVERLGSDNVFVSLHESGSWDSTKHLLRQLDAELASRGVPRHVDISTTTHYEEIVRPADESEWITTPAGTTDLRRIAYLARLRNRTIQDLVDLAKQGITFDKVLFLNDVVFTTEDVLELIGTNGGQYAAACALDFAKPPWYYDTFALRDAEGKPHLMQTWPYFEARRSRAALIQNLDAVPVQSCWNGMIIMPAEPFTASNLRFRGIPNSLAEKHLEGSECCLIHADNPISQANGVYVNPRVRVGYSVPAYEATHPDGPWLSSWQIFSGLWANRLLRWANWWPLQKWKISRRVRRWEAEGLKAAETRREAGEFCLVDEMHIISFNGWIHA